MRAGDAADHATPPIPPHPVRRERREEVTDIVRTVASDPPASSLPPPSRDVAAGQHTLFPLAPNDAAGYRLAVRVCCLMSEAGAAAEAATALRQLLHFCAHQHHWRQALPTWRDQLAVVRRFLQQVRHDRGRQRVPQLLPLIRQVLASADPLMELCEQTALRLAEQAHGNADMAALLAFLNEAWGFFAAPPSASPFPSPSRASGADARSFLPTGCALQIITSLSRRDASLACHFLEWYPRADGRLCLRVANACARAADQGGDPLPLLERVRQVMRVRGIPMSAYLLATFVNGIARTACARDARHRPADDAGHDRGRTRTAQRSAAFAVRLVDALLLEFGLAPGTAAAAKATEDASTAGRSSATRLQADATLHNAVVDAYVRCNEWSRARQYVQHHTRRPAGEGGAMPRRVNGNDVDRDDFPTIDTYNILLKGMAVQACASPTPQAVASLQRFFARQIPVPKDAITYNIMLKACAELDDYRTAFAILDEAVARFPQPVAATAGRKERTAGNLGHGVVSVLSGLGRRNQVSAALQWLRAHGQQLLSEASQLIAFSALVAACFQHHQVQHAWELFREALPSARRDGPGGHNRDGESAPAGSGEVRAQVDRADPERLDALTGLYNAMITGLCRHQRVDEALELREEMVREGVPRTATTYHALMNGLVHSKPSAPQTPWKAASGATTDRWRRRRWTRVEDAEHLAKQHMQREMPPTTVSYSILLHGYGMERDVAQVRRVFREMLQLRLRPQLVTLNTLLRALVRCDEVALAEQVFDEIFERRPEAPPSSTIASPAAKSSPSPWAWLAVRGHRPNALPAAILRAVSGLEPDAHSYSILVSALMRSGRQDAALARFAEMRARRVRPDHFFYRMMIGIAVEQRRLDIGLQVLQAAEADVPEALLQEWRARLDVWEAQARDAPARGDGQRSAAEEIFRRHRWNPIDSRARWFF